MTRLGRRLTAKRIAVHEDRGLRRAVESLVAAVNGHDTYTGGHSCRVSEHARTLARLRGLAADEVELIRQAGLVHDVGKISIPDKILQKREPLTEQEFDLIRLHPVLGASILSRLPAMGPMIPIVLHHHERWDGNGYPQSLAQEDIPLGARIIFCVDAFDAMTTERPYGDTLTVHEALKEMRRNAGTQFDPYLVTLMCEAYEARALAPRARPSVRLIKGAASSPR